MDTSRVVIGMADMKVLKSSGLLVTIGLGSCVGITFYDPIEKVAGMAHVMLPDSTAISTTENPAKFVNTAVEKLLMDMKLMGAQPSRMIAKLVGGAQMFAFNTTNESLRIGDRNVEAAHLTLRQYRVPIIAEEVGGTFGRTIELCVETGHLLVKSVGQKPRYI